jgi:nucleotide-binding universal stress UspA family protein
MYTRILLPIDGSPRSHTAAEYARDLMKLNPSASLTILHVRRKQERAYRVYRWTEVEVPPSEEEKRRICEAEERVFGRAEKIFGDAGLVTDTEVVEGSAAEEICAYAERGGYDLIVLGTRPGGEIRGILGKSVSRQVLRWVRCPVLMVKA